MTLIHDRPNVSSRRQAGARVHPVLYEINTRCWLRELSDKSGAPVLLDSVPESEFAEWERLGFTHIWLMGIWSSGPLARAKALGQPGQDFGYARALPDWKPEDVGGSAYAIRQYHVPLPLGGEQGLRQFRANLHRHGMKLILDFVPNHVGIDHPWILEKPELFVQTSGGAPESFSAETIFGAKWLAHGKDPNFAAWTDTVQLDYRCGKTRATMSHLLLEIAELCDGVRCDMAMLLLNQVFARTWSRWPAHGPIYEEEFWAGAIQRIKKEYPDFLFLAEAYWGLEPDLQALGFDYTYDKSIYDHLISGNAKAARQHLLALTPKQMAAGCRFLENHDEPRIASLLSLQQHRAAALLILALPGMRLLHEGQLSGARLRSPVQLTRRAPEPEQPEVRQLYEELLGAMKASGAGQGTGLLLDAQANGTEISTVAIRWPARKPAAVPAVNATGYPPGSTDLRGDTDDGFHLALINYSQAPCACKVPVQAGEPPDSSWQMLDLLEKSEHPQPVVIERGEFSAQLKPYAAHLLRFFRRRSI